MEIEIHNTSLKVGDFEIKLITVFGENCFAVIDGTRVRYFNNLSDALNAVNSNVQDENCVELVKAVARK